MQSIAKSIVNLARKRVATRVFLADEGDPWETLEGKRTERAYGEARDNITFGPPLEEDLKVLKRELDRFIRTIYEEQESVGKGTVTSASLAQPLSDRYDYGSESTEKGDDEDDDGTTSRSIITHPPTTHPRNRPFP
jgi:hypothetical protein